MIIPQLSKLTLSDLDDKITLATAPEHSSCECSSSHDSQQQEVKAVFDQISVMNTDIDIDNNIASPPKIRPQDTLLEVTSTPDRGLAVFTTRKIKAGTLLLVETPLINLSKHEEDDPAAVEREFSRLSRSVQKQYLRLFDAQKSRMSRVASIYYSNCYNCDAFRKDQGSAIGALASRINHSCVPNVQFSYHKGEMRFHAIRDIPRGKEVTSNYDKAVFESKAKRQRKQQIYYGFVCRCEACDPQTEFWSRSDQRRNAMYEAFRAVQGCENKFVGQVRESKAGDGDVQINTHINTDDSQSKPGDHPQTKNPDEVQKVVIDDALTALTKLEELLLKEGLAGMPLANTYRSLAKWAERKHDFSQIRTWKWKEMQACVVAFGRDAARTREIEEKLAALEKMAS